MTLYIILPFISLFVLPNMPVRQDNLSRRKNYILIAWVIMYIVLCGLRNEGGADDLSYRAYYERNYGGEVFSFLGDKESLFNIIRQIGYRLNVNYKWMFLCYAIFTSVFIALALKKLFTDNSDLTVYIAAMLFLSYSGMFTTMRQAVAMALLLYVYSLKNMSWKKNIILWLVIICCHSGFLIVLVVEVIAKLLNYRTNRAVRILLPLGCLVIGQTVDLSTLIQFITSRVGLYSYMNTSSNFEKSSALGLVFYVSFAFYIVKEWLYYKNSGTTRKTSDGEMEIKNKIVFGQMVFFSLFFLTGNLRWGNRIGYYYNLFPPFIIVELYRLLNLESVYKKTVSWGIVLFLYVCFLAVMNAQFGAEGYQWSLNFYE